jgi:dTDP-4-amino-4,6-dideoxygalactose transaminase
MTATSTPIPLVDLKAQYRSIQTEVDEAVARVLARGDFILGEDVREFEREYAAWCGTGRALGCASGTDAIHLACRALGIGPGDEVLVPAFTFVASALGVTLAGARPVLVDVDPDTALMDPARAAEAIGPKTRALLPVHLYGQVADMDALLALARERGLRVIEDAAQAHGAHRGGPRAGALGDVGCFSFYPGKNLGAYGDGGAVVTGDGEAAAAVELLRTGGTTVKYHHETMGLNSRLDTVQAAVLRVKLKRLDGWNDARRGIAARYDQALADVPGAELTRTHPGSVYHRYVVRMPDTKARDAALEALQAAGIFAGLHYPFAVHELGAYSWLDYGPGSFPVSEDWARRCLSLPIYAELPDEAVERAAQVLRACS